MHVLVIEDEPELAGLIKRALGLDLHLVEVAYDGRDGLQLAASSGFDLLVLDILLPGLDGLELCRQLRRRGVHTPVLMLTARAAVDQRVEGLEAGADDYLTKPFAIAELRARVKALGRRPAVVGEAILQVDDITLDLEKLTVQIGGEPIYLTRKEFALLEYLMRHANNVLSREQILDHVWGYDSDAALTEVDLYVHYLRKKLGSGNAHKAINTVRGVGYSMRRDE